MLLRKNALKTELGECTFCKSSQISRREEEYVKETGKEQPLRSMFNKAKEV